MGAGDEQENIEARERETRAINNLTRRLNQFGGVLGTVVRGAPQDLSDFTRGISATLTNALSGAEAYVGVWQELTKYGVNFGNELDQMITKVGKAGISMEKFANIVQANSVFFAGFGVTADSGAQRFLQAVQDFTAETENGFNPLYVELQRLGLSASDVADRFAEQMALDALRGFRERRSENEQNRRVTEYAKQLDRLSRLTGVQSDELARQQRQIAMEGDIFAFSQQIGENVQDEFENTITALGTISPEVQRYATQMLTRGFIDPDDPAMVQIQRAMPQLRDALIDMRYNLLDGASEGVVQMNSQMAIAAAAGIRDNIDMQRMAILGGVTEYTGAARDILTNSASSALALSYDDIMAQAREEFGLGDDQQVSVPQFMETMNKMIDEEIAAQGGEGGTGQQALETYLASLRKAQELAKTAQDEAVTAIFGAVTGAADRIREEIEGVDLNSGLQGVLTSLRAFAAGVTDITPELDNLQRAGQGLQRDLLAISQSIADENAQGALELSQTAAALGSAVADLDRDDPATVARLSEMITQAESILRQVDTSSLEFTDPGIPEISDEVLEILRENNNGNRMFGSLGTVGRLFENFGTETPMNLHGIESVVTPEQMADIVHHSAMGAIRAVQTSIDNNSFGNNTNVLAGMLNTIRNIPAEISAQPQQTTGMSELETAMSRLASQMRGPLEEAMNNTLVPRMEQLVQVNTRNADTSDKIRKGIGNIGSDMLRSV